MNDKSNEKGSDLECFDYDGTNMDYVLSSSSDGSYYGSYAVLCIPDTGTIYYHSASGQSDTDIQHIHRGEDN